MEENYMFDPVNLYHILPWYQRYSETGRCQSSISGIATSRRCKISRTNGACWHIKETTCISTRSSIGEYVSDDDLAALWIENRNRKRYSFKGANKSIRKTWITSTGNSWESTDAEVLFLIMIKWSMFHSRNDLCWWPNNKSGLTKCASPHAQPSFWSIANKPHMELSDNFLKIKTNQAMLLKSWATVCHVTSGCL